MHEAISPDTKTLQIGDRDLVISPLRVRELPGFSRAIREMVPQLEAGDIGGLIADHYDALLDAVTIAARVEREALEEYGWPAGRIAAVLARG